jgi:cytochrome P450
VISLLRGKWNRDLLPLSEKYGPVVRVLPNELVFTDPDAVKDIYGHRNGAVVKGEEFDKSGLFYRVGSIPPSILSETRDNHALLRRQLSHGFSEKSMREQEPIIKQYVDLLMIRLKEKCALASGAGDEKEKLVQSKAVVDLRDWYTFTTFDVIGDLAFGEPFGCLEKSEKNERVSTIEDLISSQNIGLAVRTMGLDRLFSLVAKGISRFQQEMMEHMGGSLRRRMALKVERPDLIEGLLKKQEDWVGQVASCPLIGNAAGSY